MILARRRAQLGILVTVCFASFAFEPAAYGKLDPAHVPFPPGFEAPLPPPRPAGLTPTPAAPQNRSEPPQVQAPEPSCQRALNSPKMITAAIPPVTGPDGCGIDAPIKLEAIVLEDGSHVPLEPPAIIRCTLAEALDDWMREDVAVLAQKTGGSGLAKILGSEGYECRPRNRVQGAKLSEHGKGNAYDMLGIVLRDGRQLLIAHETEARDVMAQLNASSCARFMTVLGPGSDGFHETHLHVDLAERHNNYRICQWDLK